uniref:Expressed protein n=1 Tax=Schizophyllum commune (strain H4-8 / FGSC 9210) TaxID=578458 RepID=D8QEN6_SCHCM
MITSQGHHPIPNRTDPRLGHPPPVVSSTQQRCQYTRPALLCLHGQIITSTRRLLTSRGPLVPQVLEQRTCPCTKYTLALPPCPHYIHHHLSRRTASPRCQRSILQSHHLHRKRRRSSRAPRPDR